MKISDFANDNQFSVSKKIDFDNLDVTHTINDSIDGDIDILTEESYNKLRKYLSDRLKPATKFFKKGNIAYHEATVYIASGNTISELLSSFNNLTDEQKVLAIEYFTKK